MIKVIEQTTAERNLEIKENFNLIKPYLDKGYSYTGACIEVGLGNDKGCSSRKWFKDLREYGEAHGYAYKDYKYPNKNLAIE